MTLLKEMPEKLKLEAGGRWFPKHCASWQRVAVIVPYRNREKHLNIFLQNMHPFLQAQQLDYGIFVIEQVFLIFNPFIIVYNKLYIIIINYIYTIINYIYNKL